MTNSLKEEISLTITTIDTLIVNLKNNIRIDSKRIFIVKKITKKYIESLNLVLTMNMNKKSDEIDDSLKKDKLFQFTKYFQKLHKNTDYLFLDGIIELISYKIPQDLEFYFWGHSLDISDKDYIKDVFYVVEKTQSKIKIFYH